MSHNQCNMHRVNDHKVLYNYYFLLNIVHRLYYMVEAHTLSNICNYNILSTKLDTKHHIQWHCVNANSNLSVLDTFLNPFENSYLSFNGSSISNEALAKQKLFGFSLKQRIIFYLELFLKQIFLISNWWI